jgi:hypothetical protein
MLVVVVAVLEQWGLILIAHQLILVLEEQELQAQSVEL